MLGIFRLAAMVTIVNIIALFIHISQLLHSLQLAEHLHCLVQLKLL